MSINSKLPVDRVIVLQPTNEPEPPRWYWAAPVACLLMFSPLFF